MSLDAAHTSTLYQCQWVFIINCNWKLKINANGHSDQMGKYGMSTCFIYFVITVKLIMQHCLICKMLNGFLCLTVAVSCVISKSKAFLVPKYVSCHEVESQDECCIGAYLIYFFLSCKLSVQMFYLCIVDFFFKCMTKQNQNTWRT